MIPDVLKIGPHVTAVPVVHGSGDFAWEVRRIMMSESFDCVAIPLPASFQTTVEQAILSLPTPSVVFQKDLPDYQLSWSPDDQPTDDDSQERGASFVPIDPCQPVIAALRTAMGDRLPRHFIDLETSRYRPYSRPLPDAYALKKLPLEKFAAAVTPFLTAPDDPQWRSRIHHMACQLRELSIDYKNILFVTSVLDWPWIRQAFLDPAIQSPEHESVEEVAQYQVEPDTFYFLLGELPLITGLYEQARSELESDDNLSIDGVKELLLLSRDTYVDEYKNRARKITPKLLSQCLKYIRNLSLIENRFTPQLTSIVTAAKQVAGDGYALHVLQNAKNYKYATALGLPEVRMAVDRAAFPDDDVMPSFSRLPGPPVVLTHIELIPKPEEKQIRDWKQKWNPYSQCSWPPEDTIIENFRQSVFDRAKEVMGADLAQTEKFTTSLKDGIDIRDTVRHWYDGDIYVKVLPPNKGRLDCSVMLFDAPADPREYPWRTTWFAEHKEESTLAFFATNFADQPVGPGICLANYGGAMFLFPPVQIPDIWSDPRLEFATTLEEQLLGAACLHSECPHIALVSAAPPGPAWKQIAKRFKKQWVHLPLSRFSDSTVQQLRMVHVLNGKDVRSYAADFIRKI
ncbi:MAG: hypothetical protein AAFN77_04525 [Planctomycetota bacterium]